MAIIREAVKTGSEATVRILNYRKGGEPFWNMLTIAPMADVDGTSRFFIGVQVGFLHIRSTKQMRVMSHDMETMFTNCLSPYFGEPCI